MDLVVYDDEDRRYVPAAVAVLIVLVATALAAALAVVATRGGPTQGLAAQTTPTAATGQDVQSPPPQSEPPAAGSTMDAASTEAVAGCVAETLRRADAVLQRAERLDEALAEYTRVMDDVLAKKLTTPEALDRTLPVLTRAASERKRYADESAAYQRQRSDCGA